MSEPQQGLTYAEILALARTAEDAGFESFLPIRPLRQLPRRGRPADHRRVDHARRAGARDDAHRPGHARLAGDLPLAGQPGQGRHDCRRDERWPRRAGPGRRLERCSSTPARPRVPGRRASASTCSRSSSRSSTACGPSRTAGVRRRALAGARCAFLPKARGARGPSPSEHDRRRRGEARAWRALVARYADEINITSATPSAVERGLRARRATPVAAIGRDPAEVTRSAMVGVSSAATRLKCAGVSRS